MVVMTRSRRRMMAAESPTTILPEEVMIEILNRVELDNTLQLRCVCKSWKSLVVDPQFVKNHLFKLLNDITVLFSKSTELFNTFKSQFLINNPPLVPQEQVDDDDEDEDGEEEAAEEEDDAAVEEEEEKEEKKEEEKNWLMTTLAELDGVLVNVSSLKGDLKFINLDTQMQDVEDRMKCLRSFLRIYLKSETFSSSSSHF